jgi:CPA2 family monovalent cation:H+ antiporter-2
MHDLPLITTIAAAFFGAWVLGLATQRLGLSPIVGYLIAGVLIGPHTPGFVGDLVIAQQLAEVGVILLMFGVGLHFHLADLLAVKWVAIPGALGQSVVATLSAIVVFHGLGVPIGSAAVIGMAMSVASTVVLMRVLMDAGALDSPRGHVAVGWLIVEDILTVVLLVLIPVLGDAVNGESHEGPAANPWTALGLALAKLVALVALVFLAGSRLIPWILVRVARLRSRELFTLTVLVFSIAVAAGSYTFFGASMALGAFLAGMVVSQSPVSHQAAADALPMRDAFAVLFFVSVGMLFDPMFIVDEPLMIVAGLGIILIVKPITALAIVALIGYPVRTGLTVALGLAQIGEFSFILSQLAREHHLMTDAGNDVLVASAIISITINPLLFRSLGPIESWIRRRKRLWSLLNGRAERRADAFNAASQTRILEQVPESRRLAIVVGYGPVGRTVHARLRDAGLETVIIDLNLDTVLELEALGVTAVYGDASRDGILERAGVRRAEYVIITLPGASDCIAVLGAVRSLHPTVTILVRARYLRERGELEQVGATAAVYEEAEAADALAKLVLDRISVAETMIVDTKARARADEAAEVARLLLADDGKGPRVTPGE